MELDRNFRLGPHPPNHKYGLNFFIFIKKGEIIFFFFRKTFSKPFEKSILANKSFSHTTSMKQNLWLFIGSQKKISPFLLPSG